MTPEQLKNKICGLLDDKKGVDITVLDVGKLTVLADYFIVASGTSATNVRALAEYVEDKLEKEDGLPPLRREGVKDARWAVYDYGSVIVHILLDDMRLFYCLEKLWSDGGNIEKYVGKDPKATEKAAKPTVKKPAVKKTAVKTTETAAKPAAKKPAARAAAKKPAAKSE
jgi:ribosome-associated protein